MPNHAHCFTADYTDSSVTIAGKHFPAGYFVVELLNACAELHFPEHAGLHALGLTMEMNSGTAEEKTFWKAKNDVVALFEAVCNMLPFSLLCDSQIEISYFDEVFDMDNVASLRAVVSTPGYMGVPLDENGALFQPERLASIDAMREELSALLPFYAELDKDIENGLRHIMTTCKAISKLPRPNKGDLYAAAKESGLDELTPASMRRYVFAEAEDGELSVSSRMVFTRYITFLTSDFFEGIRYGHYPKQCANCGRWFLITDGIHRRYCDGIDPDDPKQRTCRKVAVSRRQRENSGTHPVKKLSMTRTATIRKHKERRKLTEDEYARAVLYIEDCRDKAISDHNYAVDRYNADMELTEIYAAIGKHYTKHVKGGSP